MVEAATDREIEGSRIEIRDALEHALKIVRGDSRDRRDGHGARPIVARLNEVQGRLEQCLPNPEAVHHARIPDLGNVDGEPNDLHESATAIKKCLICLL